MFGIYTQFGLSSNYFAVSGPTSFWIERLSSSRNDNPRRSHSPRCRIVRPGVHLSYSSPFPLPSKMKSGSRVVWTLLIPNMHGNIASVGVSSGVMWLKECRCCTQATTQYPPLHIGWGPSTQGRGADCTGAMHTGPHFSTQNKKKVYKVG